MMPGGCRGLNGEQQMSAEIDDTVLYFNSLLYTAQSPTLKKIGGREM